MDEVLSVDQIKARYVAEWVLIGDPVETEALEIISGRVLFHSPDADETYRKATELRPGRFATVFTGELAEDLDRELSPNNYASPECKRRSHSRVP